MSSEIRNKKLKINIIAGFCLKGLSISLGFVFIPLVLNYLASSRYGIWLTINSVIAWFSYFDIGLSGSLRLKLQEFFANKEYDKAKEYCS
jgi:O-antigen/teichoic acid export membrane protein